MGIYDDEHATNANGIPEGLVTNATPKRFIPRLRNACCGYMDEHPDGDYVLASDYDALSAQLAEVRKDAERYRWLRDDYAERLDSGTPHVSAVHVTITRRRLDIDAISRPYDEQLDAAIDDALAQKENGNG